MFRKSPTRSWLLVVIYLIALFGSLPFVREAVIALRQQDLLGISVTLLYVLVILGVVYHVVFDVRLSDRVAFLALAVLAAIAGAMVLGLSITEERVHFLQYGVLALLIRRALAWHFPPKTQYLGAIALATLAGWLDEVVQGYLPTRFYDTRDVAINGVAAVFAIAANEVLHNRLGWLPTTEKDATDPDRG